MKPIPGPGVGSLNPPAGPEGPGAGVSFYSAPDLIIAAGVGSLNPIGYGKPPGFGGPAVVEVVAPGVAAGLPAV